MASEKQSTQPNQATGLPVATADYAVSTTDGELQSSYKGARCVWTGYPKAWATKSSALAVATGMLGSPRTSDADARGLIVRIFFVDPSRPMVANFAGWFGEDWDLMFEDYFRGVTEVVASYSVEENKSLRLELEGLLARNHSDAALEGENETLGLRSTLRRVLEIIGEHLSQQSPR